MTVNCHSVFGHMVGAVGAARIVVIIESNPEGWQ
jgi:hypothetical protein